MSASPPAKKPRPPDANDEGEDPAVTRFREYLRIRTVAILPDDTTSPKPDYGTLTLCSEPQPSKTAVHNLALNACSLYQLPDHYALFPSTGSTV